VSQAEGKRTEKEETGHGERVRGERESALHLMQGLLKREGEHLMNREGYQLGSDVVGWRGPSCRESHKTLLYIYLTI
jgi:hypothetical protein